MHTLSIPAMQDFIYHVAFRNNDAAMVWGPPGCGKSEAIAQLAEKHKAFLCDIRLSQYDSVDLRGFPGVHATTGLTVWHAPSTLPFKGNPKFPTDRPIYLFFDEINAAVPSVFAVAYQIVNDRKCGEHELMDNVYIIAAGNRETDRGVTNRMPLPLANRFVHCETIPEVDAWCYEIQRRGLPAIGAAFMQFRKPLLSTFDPSKPDKAFATPRTWVKALNYYADGQMPVSVKQAAMAGAVGDGPAAEFWGFVDVWQKMIPIAEIIKNPDTVALPDEASMSYAVAINVSGNMTAKTVTPLHTFLCRMSPEFAVMAWQMAVKRDINMTSTKQFIDFSSKYRAIF